MKAVLTYHSVDRSGSVISVEPETFRRHMEWLAKSGIEVLSLESLVGSPPDRDALAITFDDGFTNFAKHAWPVLESLRLPATLFVATAHVGATNAWEAGGSGIPVQPLLGWEELRELVASGLRLGSHSESHADLRRLGPALLMQELEASAVCIRRETGVEATAFAYPYGALNDVVVQAVHARYQLAVTTEFRLLHETEDAARLPRLDTYYFRSPGRLEQWGTPAFRRFIALRGRLRRARSILREGLKR